MKKDNILFALGPAWEKFKNMQDSRHFLSLLETYLWIKIIKYSESH